MRYYRLYFMDGFDGHIESFRDFEASDDGDAVMIAHAWRKMQPMELWCGPKKIHAFAAAGERSARKK